MRDTIRKLLVCSSASFATLLCFSALVTTASAQGTIEAATDAAVARYGDQADAFTPAVVQTALTETAVQVEGAEALVAAKSGVRQNDEGDVYAGGLNDRGPLITVGASTAESAANETPAPAAESNVYGIVLTTTGFVAVTVGDLNPTLSQSRGFFEVGKCIVAVGVFIAGNGTLIFKVKKLGGAVKVAKQILRGTTTKQKFEIAKGFFGSVSGIYGLAEGCGG